MNNDLELKVVPMTTKKGSKLLTLKLNGIPIKPVFYSDYNKLFSLALIPSDCGLDEEESFN